MIVWAVMDVWSLNHFHTQAPTLHEAYCTLHAAYSSSPESILKWTKEISPIEGVEVGVGWCTPLHIGWAQLGGEVVHPPHLGWAQLGGEVVHLPNLGWAQLGGGWCTSAMEWEQLGVVDIQAFEVRDGALCRKKILARLGGVVHPPSLSGLGARLGGVVVHPP